jgi:hypothetical protein
MALQFDVGQPDRTDFGLDCLHQLAVVGHILGPMLRFFKYFCGKKFGEKIGVFDSKQS